MNSPDLSQEEMEELLGNDTQKASKKTSDSEFDVAGLDSLVESASDAPQVKKAEFSDLNQFAETSQINSSQIASAASSNMSLLMDVPMNVTVELGRASRKIKEILSLNVGSVVELDKLSGEPVDILVNGKIIAKAEVVVIDENFGVRITEVIDPKQRLTLDV